MTLLAITKLWWKNGVHIILSFQIWCFSDHVFKCLFQQWWKWCNHSTFYSFSFSTQIWFERITDEKSSSRGQGCREEEFWQCQQDDRNHGKRLLWYGSSQQIWYIKWLSHKKKSHSGHFPHQLRDLKLASRWRGEKRTGFFCEKKNGHLLQPQYWKK